MKPNYNTWIDAKNIQSRKKYTFPLPGRNLKRKLYIERLNKIREVRKMNRRGKYFGANK